MNQPVRIALVTAGLMVGGAVFGALAAVIALAVALLATGGTRDLFVDDAFALAAFVGALFGGILLPCTGWVLLRQVPLGLTVVGTVAGTVAGGALGWMLPLGSNEINRAIWGALAGFFAAALLLRLVASAPRVPRKAAA
ncbi:MAG TPA: hypothetical protein VFX98_14505 [Longimicrobiaceae bacterium]|nr:hypothetical protein [Longimicrobiaceae bacterium]